MKKLKLQALQFGAKDILSRAQLKNVLGGDGSDGGSGSGGKCTGRCSSDIGSGTACTSSTFGGIVTCSCSTGSSTNCKVE
jgi:hypothetical protein